MFSHPHKNNNNKSTKETNKQTDDYQIRQSTSYDIKFYTSTDDAINEVGGVR